MRFSSFLNWGIDVALVILGGNEFRIKGAVTVKERSPADLSCVLGIFNLCVDRV